MPLPQEILKQYWGYDTFRKGQLEIVESVIQGQDTLALLPTGGGKSICFQVPALAKEGICIVVSPLMALMQDQVANLKKRGIKAYAVTSAMSFREIDRVLDNCIYGDVKFLYISPERILSELFSVRCKKMNVSMIAVDEAHCISQWGYDFRPAYLGIAAMREWHPNAPVLALTASATPEVVIDIQDKLGFIQQHVISNSFARENLAYIVMREEDKVLRIIELVKKLKGSGIVYCGTRSATREMAVILEKNGICANFYHAGMTANQRDKAFKAWMKNQKRVVCATNAFGMGIDKPDVRFVLHADVPANPESYFQEAGRGGRDGNEAYSVLLFNDHDLEDLIQKVEQRYPPKETVLRIFNLVCDFLSIGVGSGQFQSYPFLISAFCEVYQLKALEVTHALRLMQMAGFIEMSDALIPSSRLMITANRTELYSFQVAHPVVEQFIKTLLRMYGGLFDDFVYIKEQDIARNTKMPESQVIQYLKRLQEHHIADYQLPVTDPRIVFLQARPRPQHIDIPHTVYEDRKKVELIRAKAMQDYLMRKQCRSQLLLDYFGEKNTKPCGKCDVCRARKKQGMTREDIQKIESLIIDLAQQGETEIDELITLFPGIKNEFVIDVFRNLIDREVVVVEDGVIRMKY